MKAVQRVAGTLLLLALVPVSRACCCFPPELCPPT
jgi:hypothetical protein